MLLAKIFLHFEKEHSMFIKHIGANFKNNKSLLLIFAGNID
jgi:hypothetical protein